MIDQKFKALAKSAEAFRFLEPLKAAMALHGIDTPLRVSHFLAQLAHESAGFSIVVENLNYSAVGLATTWPRRFRGSDNKPNALALGIQRKPQMIANHVYANRMGNGDAASGDGWTYRGRGLIQLTGKSNYQRASLEIYGDDRLVINPDLVAEPDVAALTACWFWSSSDLNSLADLDDVAAVTRKINGGTVGLDHRKQLTQLAMEAPDEQTLPKTA
jgi:putative chitinase